MTELHSRSLLDLGPPDLQAHLENDDSILIPLGSCEMHGAHMPLGTDIYNAIEVCKRAAEIADTVYAPPIWTGYSPQHLRQPEAGMGTITFRAETVVAVIHDTVRSLIHHGFNRLIFVNGHTSNTKVTDAIFRELRYETGALAGHVQALRRAVPGLDRGPHGESAGGDARAGTRASRRRRSCSPITRQRPYGSRGGRSCARS